MRDDIIGGQHYVFVVNNCGLRRTESARVKNKALKIAFLNLSTSRSDYLVKVKWYDDEAAFFYEITFGQLKVIS